MILGDVVDEFHDDDGLAHARAAEEADLAALQERLNEIDDLHAGLEHFGAGGLLVERGSEAMNGHALFVFDGAELIDGLSDHVHDATRACRGRRERKWARPGRWPSCRAPCRRWLPSRCSARGLLPSAAALRESR